jgi:hypothetical protein
MKRSYVKDLGFCGNLEKCCLAGERVDWLGGERGFLRREKEVHVLIGRQFREHTVDELVEYQTNPVSDGSQKTCSLTIAFRNRS